MVFFFIDFLEERECEEMLLMKPNGLVSTFSFLHAINTDKHHINSPIITKAS